MRHVLLPIAAALCGVIWYSIPMDAQSAAVNLPIREITIFKDGNAFVLHSGRAATDADGNILMDSLPKPVLGTFWPYANDSHATLTAVTASPQHTTVERVALNLRELLEANPGAQVEVVQKDGRTYAAQVVEVPHRPLEAPDTVRASERSARVYYNYSGGFGAGADAGVVRPVPQADAVLLKTKDGVLALPFEQVKSIAFKGAYRRAFKEETLRNRMKLKLDWNGAKPEKTAAIGMVYLQKGIRWVPNYKITIDGAGKAAVKMQATLINEMIDLKDVTAYLVVGVPSFQFKELADPISLQQTFPELSRYFQPDAQTGYAFSNSIMGQGLGGQMAGGQSGGSTEPTQPGPLNGLAADRNEDLFLFTAKHLSLKKGESMTIPVTEFVLTYKDVYALEVQPTVPDDAERNMSREQLEMLRQLRGLKVQHRLRLSNGSAYPLTTAPALILKDDRVVAQGLITYTAVGAESDLTLTTAVQVSASKSEQETERVPNSLRVNNNVYQKVQMEGKITLTNRTDKPIEVEVTRYIDGHVDTVSDPGVKTMVNPDDDPQFLDYRSRYNYYYGSYRYGGVNGVGRFFWKVQVPARGSLDLTYSWHLFTG